jgi:hypothetical protein
MANIQPSWQHEYVTLIDDCENRESRMSEWEANFCDSLRRQIEDGRMPSIKQIEKLDELWGRVTANG